MRVRITARFMASYDQIVEMTPREWNKFKETSPRNHTMGGGDLIGGWLEPNDFDADDIDPNEFEAVVVDKDGKPTGDLYQWENENL